MELPVILILRKINHFVGVVLVNFFKTVFFVNNFFIIIKGTTGKYCEFLDGCYQYYQVGYKCQNNGTCLQSAEDYFNNRYEW